jgi:hypothetical protein
MLRQILPQLITLFFSLIIIWVAAAIVKKYWIYTIKAAWGITAIVLFFFIWWMVKIASVNDIPRATIDRTNKEKMVNSFEERVNETLDTSKNKK